MENAAFSENDLNVNVLNDLPVLTISIRNYHSTFGTRIFRHYLVLSGCQLNEICIYFARA